MIEIGINLGMTISFVALFSMCAFIGWVLLK